MIVYILLAGIVGLLAFYETGQRSKSDVKLLYYGLLVFLLVVGFRYGQGDYPTYEMGYNERIDVGGDAGYYFIQLFFEKLGLSFKSFVFILSLVSVIAIYRTYRLSVWPVFGLVVILGKFFTLYAMSGIRQYMAMVICWWAISELLLNKRRVLFVVMVLFAYTLHGSAIIVLPVILLKDVVFSLNKASIMLMAAFLIGLFFHQFFEQMANYSDFVDDRFGTYYRDSVIRGGETMNVLNFFENFLFLFLAIRVRKRALRYIPYYDFFLYMFLIYCAFLLAGREVGVVKRLRDYYGIAYAFIVPGFYYFFKDIKNRQICRVILIGYFILLMFRSLSVYDEGLSEGATGTMVPYHSIFQTE